MSSSKASSFKSRLFWLLWLIGMAGVLSLLLIPLPPPTAVAIPAVVLKLLILLQPTVLLSVAVAVGVQLAPRVGLSAPVATALVQRKNWIPPLRSQAVPGLLGGLISGLVLVLINALVRRFLPPAFLTAAAPPLAVRFLYGGITEELLLRWGVMTFLVWLGWRFGRQGRRPSRRWVKVSIVLSSILFAVAHLPFVLAIGVPLNPLLVAFLLIQNSLFSLVAGYLYWHYGLEAAIIAHWGLHIVLAVA